MKNKNIITSMLLSLFLLTGCGAMSTAIQKRNLAVSTQLSNTIWVEPSDQKTVYIQIKNTSDKDMNGLQPQITHELQLKGYSVMTSPDDAYYWVQVNVLKAEKMDLREGRSFLNQGYQGAAAGVAVGGGIAAFNTSSTGAVLGIGLASGLIGAAADSIVEDVNYGMITDVQITERTQANVTTTDIANLQQGTSGQKQQISETKSHQHKYQTRVVSNANKANLKYEEAKPILEQQLAKTISNIL